MTPNHVLTIAGAKGGVGKTTTSINLAASLSAAGHTAVVLELDLAMANLVDFLDVDIDDGATLHEVLADEVAVEEAVYDTSEGLGLVPSGTQLGGYADADLDNLQTVVEQLRRQFDLLLIDTPAGLSDETIRPMGLADGVVLVSTPRVASVRNVRNTMELAERVGVDICGLVLTKSGTGASPGAQRIADFLDLKLLGRVPEDDAVPHSQDHGQPVVQHAPHSGAAIAYDKIATKLVRDEEAPVAEQPPKREDGSESADEDATTQFTTTRPPSPDDSETEETTHRVVDRSTAVASTDGGDERDRTDADAETQSVDAGGLDMEPSPIATVDEEEETGDKAEETDAEDEAGEREESGPGSGVTGSTAETSDSETEDDEPEPETADSLVGKVRTVIGL